MISNRLQRALAFAVIAFPSIAGADQLAPPTAIVLEPHDERPANLASTDKGALRRLLEQELAKNKRLRVVSKKLGADEKCANDACGVQVGRKLGVEKIISSRIEVQDKDCMVYASILDTKTDLAEVSTSRKSACDQSAVLATVKKELAPALRGEPIGGTDASKKAKPVALTDKRLTGMWTIEHVKSKYGRAPNLTGGELTFEADGKYRAGGTVRIDRDDAPEQLAFSGTYGFDGKALSIQGWGNEFSHCQVVTKKPAAFDPSAFDERELDRSSTCKIYFENPDLLWVWYPGPEVGLILDKWKRTGGHGAK